MPALTNLSYNNLPIAGRRGSRPGVHASHLRDVPKAEENRVRRHLLRYCGQDTGGMIEIVNELTRNAERA